MLARLIKYEFKITGKFMLLMYGLLIALSAIISFSLAFRLDKAVNFIADTFNAGGLILTLFIFIIAILFVALNVVVLFGMFFYAISRFKNNLLGNEGYLMHTLPVKVRDNILAKLIVAVLWTLAGFAVAAFAYFILFLGFAGEDIPGILKAASEAVVKINWNSPHIVKAMTGAALVISEFGVLSIVTIISKYLCIYASMAIGFSANTHRTVKSIAAFILLSIVSSIAEALLQLPFQAIGINISDFSHNINVAFCYGIVFTSIEAVVYYFITHYFLSKRLNLQ